MTRKKASTSRRHHAAACWHIEMLESPLIDSGIAYTVHDVSPAEQGTGSISWIEFVRPTHSYRTPAGHHEVVVRLTVDEGRLSIMAPGVYLAGSLVRTNDPPPDRDGTLRIMRLGDDDMTQIDLLMSADGFVTAALRMETIRFPFNRGEIVQIAEEFACGIDLLDFAVRQSDLLIPGRTGHDD